MRCSRTIDDLANCVARLRIARAASALLAVALLWFGLPADSQELTEYRIKAAFLYNFAVFTEWPADTGRSINLCILGMDPFGTELDTLQGKPVGDRLLAVQRKAEGESLAGCHIVVIAPSAMPGLARVLEGLRGDEVLTVADSPGAARRGVALNMLVVQNRVAFEANLPVARAAGLNLSSKLLRLATEVIQ
jgi:hypothetical protein